MDKRSVLYTIVLAVITVITTLLIINYIVG